MQKTNAIFKLKITEPNGTVSYKEGSFVEIVNYFRSNIEKTKRNASLYTGNNKLLAVKFLNGFMPLSLEAQDIINNEIMESL